MFPQVSDKAFLLLQSMLPPGITFIFFFLYSAAVEAVGGTNESHIIQMRTKAAVAFIPAS